MSPQLITTVVGLALSVLVIGGGVMSMQQSGDAAKAKKLAVEVDSVVNASKTWMANSSSDNTFNGISGEKIKDYVSGMTSDGTNLLSVAVAKGKDGTTPVSLAVASSKALKLDDGTEITGTDNTAVKVTISNVPDTMGTILKTALDNKGCYASAVSGNSMSYTCKG